MGAALGGSPSGAAADCPNAAFRGGWSNRLPDCRAYELVTPVPKGTPQDLFAFGGQAVDVAIPAEDGERVVLNTSAKLGENSGPGSSYYVFARQAGLGWRMTSVHPADKSEQALYEANIFDAKLLQVGVDESTHTNLVNGSPEQTFYVGPPGGPYDEVATTPFVPEFISEHVPDQLMGASENFEKVVLASLDHNLGGTDSGTVEGADDLYEWSKGGSPELVNVTSGGLPVSSCGANLGGGTSVQGKFAEHAVSANGELVFFTAPDPDVGFTPFADNPSCQEPLRLYMRVNGAETIEVSAPESGVVDPEGFKSVFYQGAAEDGSKVFFTTTTELTADDTGHHSNELYMYDTQTRSLTRISSGESGTAEGGLTENKEAPGVTISPNGAVVYFWAKGRLTSDAPDPGGEWNIYRYDTDTGTTEYIATSETQVTANEYTTPNGEFFAFSSRENYGGFDSGGEPQIYLYDHPQGTITCVSCPSKATPAPGPAWFTHHAQFYETPDHVPAFNVISADGTQVYFLSAAHLVPEDVNKETGEEGGTAVGQDVYEWEADGSGGCERPDGCLHLISPATEDAAGAWLLGASQDGRDVFFSTHNRLVPQDTDVMGDIYDARVDGGFPGPTTSVGCSEEACQGEPAGAPALSRPSSTSLRGRGNLHPRRHCSRTRRRGAGRAKVADRGKEGRKRPRHCKRGKRRAGR